MFFDMHADVWTDTLWQYEKGNKDVIRNKYKEKFFEYFDDSHERLNSNGMTYQSSTKEIIEIKCDDPKVIYHVFKNLPFSFKPIRKALFRIKTEYELKQVEKLRKKLEERR